MGHLKMHCNVVQDVTEPVQQQIGILSALWEIWNEKSFTVRGVQGGMVNFN